MSDMLQAFKVLTIRCSFDHTIRTKANAAKPITQETDTTKRAPVMLVHCDYTAESGPIRYVYVALKSTTTEALGTYICSLILVLTPVFEDQNLEHVR